MPNRSRQMEPWRPEELPVTHRSCPECLGVKGCLWCASGGHAPAEAALFANGRLAAQFPRKARTLPRAGYTG